MNSKPSLYIFGLLLLILIGGWIRGSVINDWPLWTDESAHWLSSAASTEITWSQFAQWSHEFESAPFSFVLPRITMDVFGTEAEWALRLPSVICGILCIPVGFLLGRVVHSDAAGLLVAAMVAFDPNMVDSSQQARMYAVLMLLVMIGVTWAIHLLRHAPRSPWQWVGIGVVMGLAFSTTQFGIGLWFGVGAAAMALIVGGKLIGQPYPHPKAAWSGGLLAFLVAGLVSHVGIVMLLERLGSGGGDGEHLTVFDIAREAIINLKELINLSPDALCITITEGVEIPLIELLVYGLGLVGILKLFRVCKTSTAVLVCLAVGNLLMLVPFRRMHHFMAPRYLSLIQPALWVGLAFAALGTQHRVIRSVLLTLVVAYIGAQAWQSVNIDRWWQQPDRYTIAEQIIDLRNQENPIESGHGVTYHPYALRYLGDYYDVPTESILHEPLYTKNHLREDATIPAEYGKPVTWMIVGMVNWDGRVENVKRMIAIFAKHYGVDPDMEKLDEHLIINQSYLLRFSKEGIQMRNGDPNADKLGPFIRVDKKTNDINNAN